MRQAPTCGGQLLPVLRGPTQGAVWRRQPPTDQMKAQHIVADADEHTVARRAQTPHRSRVNLFPRELLRAGVG